MTAAAASRAEAAGPSGFSFLSIWTPSIGKRFRAARASIGSVTMRNASAAEAAADRLRNERREVEETLRPLAITHLVRAILPQNPAADSVANVTGRRKIRANSLAWRSVVSPER